MIEYFVDTWYFIARIDPFDAHHAAARRLQTFSAAGALVTHDAVLTEVLAFFCEDGSRLRQRAVATIRETLRTFVVEPADRRLFLRGLERYAQRVDKEYSQVDCMSMVLMEERGITTVLTNDHHFTQAGFRVLTDAP